MSQGSPGGSGQVCVFFVVAAVALGKLGGLKGEKARAAKLTAEQRSEIALKGARARWANRARARV